MQNKIRTSSMKTILLMATTVDGKIGRDSSHLVDWSGKEDKKLFVKLTKDAGVIIMGSKTYDTLKGPLPNRKNIILTKNTLRLKNEKNLVFTDKPPETLLNELKAQGYEKAVLVGGAQINSLFLKSQLINEVYITIVPRLFGTGLSMFSEETDTHLALISTHQMPDGHILLKYSVSY
jgi:dihydrofolate reductase